MLDSFFGPCNFEWAKFICTIQHREVQPNARPFNKTSLFFVMLSSFQTPFQPLEVVLYCLCLSPLLSLPPSHSFSASLPLFLSLPIFLYLFLSFYISISFTLCLSFFSLLRSSWTFRLSLPRLQPRSIDKRPRVLLSSLISASQPDLLSPTLKDFTCRFFFFN